MAETLSHFSKILTNADDKVRLLKSLSYISNILSPQLFGEKDSFTFGALRQLGKHINEVHMNCNSSYRPPIPFHYCSMITFSSFLSLSLFPVIFLAGHAVHTDRPSNSTAVRQFLI